jgi:hypothetical protein
MVAVTMVQAAIDQIVYVVAVRYSEVSAAVVPTRTRHRIAGRRIGV